MNTGSTCIHLYCSICIHCSTVFVFIGIKVWTVEGCFHSVSLGPEITRVLGIRNRCREMRVRIHRILHSLLIKWTRKVTRTIKKTNITIFYLIARLSASFCTIKCSIINKSVKLPLNYLKFKTFWQLVFPLCFSSKVRWTFLLSAVIQLVVNITINTFWNDGMFYF